MNSSTSNTENSGTEKNAGDDALDLLLNPAPESATDSANAEKSSVAETLAVDEPALQLDEPPVLAELDAATRGLLMPSESDEPFRTVYWPLEKSEITSSEIALYLTENADAKVETQSVQKFLADAASIENWMNADEKARAEQFQKLSATLDDELGNPRVYLVGEREITAAIVGKVAGGFAGVVTKVIRT